MEDCLKESGESSLDYSTTMHESDEEDEVSNEAVDREEDNDTSSSATLPQMLEKYSAIYNKNGRIGIYTREVNCDGACAYGPFTVIYLFP